MGYAIVIVGFPTMNAHPAQALPDASVRRGGAIIVVSYHYSMVCPTTRQAELFVVAGVIAGGTMGSIIGAADGGAATRFFTGKCCALTHERLGQCKIFALEKAHTNSSVKRSVSLKKNRGQSRHACRGKETAHGGL